MLENSSYTRHRFISCHGYSLMQWEESSKDTEVTDNLPDLRRFMVPGPEVARMKSRMMSRDHTKMTASTGCQVAKRSG